MVVLLFFLRGFLFIKRMLPLITKHRPERVKGRNTELRKYKKGDFNSVHTSTHFLDAKSLCGSLFFTASIALLCSDFQISAVRSSLYNSFLFHWGCCVLLMLAATTLYALLFCASNNNK